MEFKDVPDSARVMYDKDGAVWVKLGGGWRRAAEPHDDAHPGELGGDPYSSRDMEAWEPFTVIDVDPPEPGAPRGRGGPAGQSQRTEDRS